MSSMRMKKTVMSLRKKNLRNRHKRNSKTDKEKSEEQTEVSV